MSSSLVDPFLSVAEKNESENGHHSTILFSYLFNAIIAVQTNMDRIDP